jgi:excisionase family DNA binding protein
MANLTVKEAAVELGVKEPTVRKWIAERRLTHVRLGRAVRIPSQTVRNFIEKNTIPAIERR